jgi:hypothetical protein
MSSSARAADAGGSPLADSADDSRRLAQRIAFGSALTRADAHWLHEWGHELFVGADDPTDLLVGALLIRLAATTYESLDLLEASK